MNKNKTDHVLQVTVLENDELCNDVTKHDIILHGIAFSGINCNISINKINSVDKIELNISKDNIVYKGILNGIYHEENKSILTFRNISTILNEHFLKINNIDYFKNNLNLISLWGELKYGFSDSKKQTGQLCLIVTPLWQAYYNITHTKKLNTLLRTMSSLTEYYIDELYGIKRVLITPDDVFYEWKNIDVVKLKNYIVISNQSKITCGSFIHKKTKRNVTVYMFSLSHVNVSIKYNSNTAYMYTTKFTQVLSNICNISREHQMIFNYKETYIIGLEFIIKYLNNADKMLGGVKKKLIPKLTNVIEEFKNFVSFYNK